MKFTQKVGKIGSLETSIEFLATGFKYSYRENTPFALGDKIDLFLNYGSIKDDETVFRYKRNFSSYLYILSVTAVFFAGVVFAAAGSHVDLVHPTIVASFGKYQAFIFWTYVLGMFTFYRTVILKKIIRIGTSGGGYISLLVDKQTKDIIAELKKRRTAYVRENLLKDRATKERLTAESVDWLFSINAIDGAEYEELVEIVRKNEGQNENAVGFETRE